MKNEPGIGPEIIWWDFSMNSSCRYLADFGSWTWSTGLGLVGRTENLLFLIQFFHKFELADQRRREGIQRPFRKWVHLVPTNRLLYYNPRIDNIIHLRRFCVGVHTLLRIISGAKYSGVPHNVHVLPFTRFAKPKSVI